MKQIIKNIIGSYKHIPYTWKHYLAFLKIEKQLLGKYKYKFHDWDKLILFIFLPFLGEFKINQLHQKYRKHHPNYLEGNINCWIRHNKPHGDVDWIEAIIDWECARFTKPDKPLNARETLFEYYPNYIEYAKPYLEKLGL